MAKKSKPSLSSQPSLFQPQDESPNSETIERAISGPSNDGAGAPQSGTHTSAETAKVPVVITCPSCGGPAAKSVKGGEFTGNYYCQGACSYGDNYYFRPEENK